MSPYLFSCSLESQTLCRHFPGHQMSKYTGVPGVSAAGEDLGV